METGTGTEKKEALQFGFLAGNDRLETLFETGVKSLDDALGGGLSVGVTILAGSPSLGKTSLAAQIAANVARCAEQDADRDVSVVYSDLETGGAPVRTRLALGMADRTAHPNVTLSAFKSITGTGTAGALDVASVREMHRIDALLAEMDKRGTLRVIDEHGEFPDSVDWWAWKNEDSQARFYLNEREAHRKRAKSARAELEASERHLSELEARYSDLLDQVQPETGASAEEWDMVHALDLECKFAKDDVERDRDLLAEHEAGVKRAGAQRQYHAERAKGLETDTNAPGDLPDDYLEDPEDYPEVRRADVSALWSSARKDAARKLLILDNTGRIESTLYPDDQVGRIRATVSDLEHVVENDGAKVCALLIATLTKEGSIYGGSDSPYKAETVITLEKPDADTEQTVWKSEKAAGFLNLPRFSLVCAHILKNRTGAVNPAMGDIRVPLLFDAETAHFSGVPGFRA